MIENVDTFLFTNAAQGMNIVSGGNEWDLVEPKCVCVCQCQLPQDWSCHDP